MGISAIRKFLEIQHGQSGQLSPLHDTPVTSHQARTRVSQVQPKMEGLSLCMSTFDLESLAESAELELAMVFVLGRVVPPPAEEAAGSIASANRGIGFLHPKQFTTQ